MSYKVYPITQTELCYEGYEVKINGEKVLSNVARVSAMPFNRRWPGHQRSLDQTELINFLSLETDEPLKFEIKPLEAFEKVVIRPVSLGIEPEITQDGRIVFTLDKPAYFTVEPYGRHNALHVFADPISSYEISKTDSDVLYFGKGEHHVGMIKLQSNQTLFLDEGAVVYACVHATDANNIKILGRGILDNSENKEQVLFVANEQNNDAAVNNVIRLHTVQFEYCTNVTVEGITIRDSLVYNIRPIGCENLNIDNVKIIGCWRYNSDGIDMHNCVDVNIRNCFIRTFDDSICVKGFDCYYEGDVERAVHDAMYRNGKCYDVFKNIRVSNCVIWNDWGKCLEIGAETRAEEICDVSFESCNIIHVTHAPLDCANVDYADVHDILFKDITVEYDDVIPSSLLQRNDEQKYENSDPEFYPPVICAAIIFHFEYSAGGSRRGLTRRMLFENIRLYSKHKPIAFDFVGYDEAHKISNIEIKGFYLNDEPLKSDDYVLTLNEFCENIRVTL